MHKTVKKIENAVSKLSREDIALFRKWFDEYQAKVWDKQFEEDVQAGKLSEVAEEVEKEFWASQEKPAPPISPFENHKFTAEGAEYTEEFFLRVLRGLNKRMHWDQGSVMKKVYAS